jgi:hypothetical protein
MSIGPAVRCTECGDLIPPSNNPYCADCLNSNLCAADTYECSRCPATCCKAHICEALIEGCPAYLCFTCDESHANAKRRRSLKRRRDVITRNRKGVNTMQRPVQTPSCGAPLHTQNTVGTQQREEVKL